MSIFHGMLDLSIKPEDLYKDVAGRDPVPFMRPAFEKLLHKYEEIVRQKLYMRLRDMRNERRLVSRNKREGWYAGWRPILACEGHRRSGRPLDGADWIPYPWPLRQSIVRRYKGPINVQLVDEFGNPCDL